MNIISVDIQEIQTNFDFCFSLVERGYTLKIKTEKGVVLMTPIANTPIVPDALEMEPNPQEVREYVSESMGELTQEFSKPVQIVE
jgi:hypothetical protein